MTDFYDLTIADIYKETKDCVVITLDVPPELHEVFAFEQGQHITLRKTINGQDIRRNYSLCTSPSEKKWKVAVKQISGGVFSTYANTQLKRGDLLSVMPPHGTFNIEIDSSQSNNLIAFAAGSGITPLLSIIKTHLISEPNSTFKLFYLNRTVKSIIFKEEIEQLKNLFFEKFQVFYFLTKEKRDIPFLNGRFDKDKLDVLTKTFIDIEDTAHAFLCGPQEMIFLIRDHLTNKGLDLNKVHYELFYAGNDDQENQQIVELIDHNTEGIQVTIINGGTEFHFIMEDDIDNILDGALQAGADLPYACKGGVCSTCKCKLIEGDVTMKVNYALEEKELAQQFVLSCQAIPTSEKVVVNFDV